MFIKKIDFSLKKTLFILGSGIKFSSHFTREFISHLEQANKVLFLVNNPALQAWIQKVNPNSESLDLLYFKNKQRNLNYQTIAEHIVKSFERSAGHVCAVFYGHPLMLSEPGFLTVQLATDRGYSVKVLPGISALDCLFADLMVDPGDFGFQSYEASHFLMYPKMIDVSSHLILWQLGSLGRVVHAGLVSDCRKYVTVLKEILLKSYPGNHSVFLYEAAQYPYFEPQIQKIEVRHLPSAIISTLTTLYIPPAQMPSLNKERLFAMDLSVTDFQDE